MADREFKVEFSTVPARDTTGANLYWERRLRQQKKSEIEKVYDRMVGEGIERDRAAEMRFRHIQAKLCAKLRAELLEEGVVEALQAAE